MLLVPATPWGTPCTPKCHLSMSSSTPGQRLTPSLRAHRAQHDPQWQTDSAPQSAGLALAFPRQAGGAEGTQAMMGVRGLGSPLQHWLAALALGGGSGPTRTPCCHPHSGAVGLCTVCGPTSGSHPGLMETGEPGGWGKGA